MTKIKQGGQKAALLMVRLHLDVGCLLAPIENKLPFGGFYFVSLDFK